MHILGPFVLDDAGGRLLRDGLPVPLTPKSFALLQHLVSRPNQLLPKAELLAAVWPGVFVTDAVLKNAIRELRRALEDDAARPRYIETAHRRGYRFLAPASSVPGARTIAPLTSAPRVQYAPSGNVNIAYQVVGDGPVDLVFVMGWVSHLEYFWNEPSFARFLTRLSGLGRLILFDKRGTGLSDPVPVNALPSLDQRLDDVRAVMEAAGSERAVLLGVSEGGPLCSLFAATYPEKTEALVMIGSYARRLHAPDYPWGQSAADHEAFCELLRTQWGGPLGLEVRAPSRVSDTVFANWWASYLRMGASPGAAVALTRMNADIDVREILPSVQVPTLVLHRSGDRCFHVDEGRYLASCIPGAVFRELPGDDHLPFVGDEESVVRAIDDFLSAGRPRHQQPSSLVSVLTLLTMSGAADDQELLKRLAVREIRHARGKVIPAEMGSVSAEFERPAKAVAAATTLLALARELRIPARAGVHIGSSRRDGADGSVSVQSRVVAESAGEYETVVSPAVAHLLPGAGFQVTDTGDRLVVCRQ
ncbi:MAG: alpha/beta fold hydrolase [Vicinamibacterales bacterium]